MPLDLIMLWGVLFFFAIEVVVISTECKDQEQEAGLHKHVFPDGKILGE